LNTRFSFNFDGVFSQVFDHLAPSILNPNRRGSASPKNTKTPHHVCHNTIFRERLVVRLHDECVSSPDLGGKNRILLRFYGGTAVNDWTF